MAKRALITGVLGQDGSYLTDLLLDEGYEVYGMVRRNSNPRYDRIEHRLDDKRLILVQGDLSDQISLNTLVKEIQPDEVYNLAAQSITADCLCPIMSAQKIEYRTLEDLWSEQIKKKKCVRTEDFHGTNVEVIDLPKCTMLKALGMWNGMGTWFKIRQISRHRWKGKVVKLTQKFGSVTVTPNHCVLDPTGKMCSPMDNPWLLNVRKLNYRKKCHETIKLQPYGVYKKDRTHFWLEENGKIGKVKRELVEEDLSVFCEFVGAYISEGSASYNIANKEHHVCISSTDKQWLEALQHQVHHFFDGRMCISTYTPKEEGHKAVYNLTLKSRALYNVMTSLCGRGSNNKKLPCWFPRLDNANLTKMWKKMVEGDGYCNNIGRTQYCTTSYKLACQIGFMLSLLDIDYSVYNEPHENNPEWHEAWYIRECDYYQPKQGEKGKKIEVIDYEGWVYDISVDEVQNFAVGVGNIVVHNSHVGLSFQQAEYTSNVTALGALRMLEAIRAHKPDAKFYQANSSEQFGKVRESPQNENTPFYPRSPYGCAKCYAHHITINYRESYGIFAVSGILFNHESPRRSIDFVTRKISDAAARCALGLTDKVGFGTLTTKRDWGYAPEYCKAMHLMLQQGEPEDFVIATGETHSIEEFLQIAFECVGLNWKDHTYTDPRFVRPAEVDCLVGDYKKAKQKLGWEPRTSFKELVSKMVMHDVKRYEKEK